MSRFDSITNSPRAFWIGALLWLPVGVILTALLRFPDQFLDPMGWMMLLGGLASLVFVAPCGLPLALACRWLWRSGYPQSAWTTMVVLGILTIGATLLAGLLGPIAIAIYAIVLSLPVWIAAGVLTRRRQVRTG